MFLLILVCRQHTVLTHTHAHTHTPLPYSSLLSVYCLCLSGREQWKSSGGTANMFLLILVCRQHTVLTHTHLYHALPVLAVYCLCLSGREHWKSSGGTAYMFLLIL